MDPIETLGLAKDCAELRDALQMALLQLQRFYRQIQKKRVASNAVSARPERPLGDAPVTLHTSDASVLHLRDPLADKFEHRWPVIVRPALVSDAAARARTVKSHSTSNSPPAPSQLELPSQGGDGELLDAARHVRRIFSVPGAPPGISERGSPPHTNVARSVDTALLSARPDAASEASAPLPLLLGAIDSGDLALVQQFLQRGTSKSHTLFESSQLLISRFLILDPKWIL